MITLAVLFCVTLSLSAPALAANRYSMEKQEKESDLSYTFGDLAAARLAVYGFLDEKYRTPQPETAREISRPDAVKLLWNAFGKGGTNLYSNADFIDVPEEYREAVIWAVENEIAQGITEAEFGVYPATETSFAAMLLNVMGYQGKYERAYALEFAESIGLVPLGLSRFFTLGDAALYLQCAMDLQTADGASLRDQMNIPLKLRQTTFPDSMILTPLSAEDAEAQIREATRCLASAITVRGDYLTKGDMLGIYRRYHRAAGEQWYISRTSEDAGFSVLMDAMDPSELSPEASASLSRALQTLREQYETGELSEEEYYKACGIEQAVCLTRGESLTMTTRYNEAWELACDLDDAFTLYVDDAITKTADDFYRRHMAGAKSDVEKVNAAKFAINCKASYAPAAGHDESGNYYAPDAHSILGFFDKNQIVCDGYASIFQYLMIRSELDCVVVLGSTVSSQKTQKNHAWNKVRVDGKWLNVDICWSDTGWPVTFDLKTDDYYADHRHWAVTYTEL